MTEGGEIWITDKTKKFGESLLFQRRKGSDGEIYQRLIDQNGKVIAPSHSLGSHYDIGEYGALIHRKQQNK